MTTFGVGTLIATGSGLVCGIVIIAGLGSGAKYAVTVANTAKLRSAVCAYASSDAARHAPSARVRLSSEQIANARKIVKVAVSLGLPTRAAEIAIGTAIQESSLTNPKTGNGSYGVFQQQPSQGWGTKQQVTDPDHAARSFYARLIEIPGWERMPLTKAAALVQRPREDLRDAYAKHEPIAKALVTLLWRGKPSRQAADTSNADDMRASIEAAAGLGIPRDEVVVIVAADLARRNPGQQLGTDELGRHADEILTTIADQFCRELEAEIGIPFDGAPFGPGVPVDNASGRHAIAARVVEFALAQMGKPYHWGAEGPDAFDCSGLAMKAYAAAGVRIPRTTFEQWPFGTRVPTGQEQPGDLVFFNSGPGSSPQRPGHVGIVVGDGKMVEARCTRCGPITIASYRSGRPVTGFTRPSAASLAK
ncbi:hypothetical protein Pth03_12300 [Planotetraspora thailandica]|uniref:NlpC/P60 domain-containing protein n=1 Tax=Planotetraspora thailandica TaxID=487172 RepID=A0A8J3UXT0_9ACTN|nr:C40 family peptidase [Planotetraspora thailandica]GII52841.1 hypothetical protein Pth03_12300 [Planotetraspora thailandica]